MRRTCIVISVDFLWNLSNVDLSLSMLEEWYCGLDLSQLV